MRSRRAPAGALAGLVVGIVLVVVPGAVWLSRPPPPAAATPPVAAAVAGVGGGTREPTVPGPAAAVSEDGPAAPARIRLVDIGVDAPVVPVGVDGQGEMAVPQDVRAVGWYRFGPAPGATGSSVLAGHVDDRVQGHGAFYRLVELAPGNRVVVDAVDGTERSYLVRAVERVDKSRLPTEQLFDRGGPPRLTLITCGGEFDRAAGHFRDNVVVRADPA